MFRFLILFLTSLLLVRILLLLILGSRVRRQQSPPGNRKAGGARSISGKTVKDPQCGMHVASSLAIPLRVNDEEYFFCSTDCRDEFRKRVSD